jgi:hypothetical protein
MMLLMIPNSGSTACFRPSFQLPPSFLHLLPKPLSPGELPRDRLSIVVFAPVGSFGLGQQACKVLLQLLVRSARSIIADVFVLRCIGRDPVPSTLTVPTFRTPLVPASRST